MVNTFVKEAQTLRTRLPELWTCAQLINCAQYTQFQGLAVCIPVTTQSWNIEVYVHVSDAFSACALESLYVYVKGTYAQKAQAKQG